MSLQCGALSCASGEGIWIFGERIYSRRGIINGSEPAGEVVVLTHFTILNQSNFIAQGLNNYLKL